MISTSNVQVDQEAGRWSANAPRARAAQADLRRRALWQDVSLLPGYRHTRPHGAGQPAFNHAPARQCCSVIDCARYLAEGDAALFPWREAGGASPRRFYALPNEATIWTGGLDDKDRIEKILGNEYCTIFFNECSQIRYSSIVVARTRLAQVVTAYQPRAPSFILPQRAYYDLNPVGTKHWSHTEFVRGLSPETGQPLAHPENFAQMSINPIDNAANLTPETLQELESLPERQRKRLPFVRRFRFRAAANLATLAAFSNCAHFCPERVRPIVVI